MLNRQTSRTLRRLVAELADVRPDDQEAILSDLPDAQARRVRELLAEYAGLKLDIPQDRPAERLSRLSPALRGVYTRRNEGRMTAAALSAFDTSIQALNPEEFPAPVLTGGQPRSPLSRIFGWREPKKGCA